MVFWARRHRHFCRLDCTAAKSPAPLGQVMPGAHTTLQQLPKSNEHVTKKQFDPLDQLNGPSLPATQRLPLTPHLGGWAHPSLAGHFMLVPPQCCSSSTNTIRMIQGSNQGRLLHFLPFALPAAFFPFALPAALLCLRAVACWVGATTGWLWRTSRVTPTFASA